MDDVIKNWLKRTASVETINGTTPYELNNETFLCSKPYNNTIGEVDVEDISSVELFPEKKHLTFNAINDKIQVNGCGGFTLKNGDYFKGEFFGDLSNREGTFIRLSKAGLTIEGTWRNGQAEVLNASLHTILLHNC